MSFVESNKALKQQEAKSRISLKGSWLFIKKNLKQIFTKKDAELKHDSLHRVLQYKAWGLNSFIVLFRTLNFISGNTTWYKPPKPPCLKLFEDDEIDAVESVESGACLLQNYNEDFVVEHHSTFKNLAIAFLILGLVLNVLIYKWRNLVDFCFLYEMLYQTIYLSVPSSQITYSVYYIMGADIIIFAMSYTSRGA